jgi:hypothetical protein
MIRFPKRLLIALAAVSALLLIALTTRYAGVQPVPGGTVVWFGSSWGVFE